MKLQNSQFLSLEQVQSQYLSGSSVRKTGNSQSISFQETLERLTEPQDEGTEVRFSRHAQSRLQDRGIELTQPQLQRLEEGTKKAGEKGIQDSLVLMDHLAFIVNVPSNTVVTAMDQNETKQNIFTNIDGAVIV